MLEWQLYAIECIIYSYVFIQLKTIKSRVWKEHNQLSDEEKVRLNVQSLVEDVTGDRHNLSVCEII